MGSRVKNKTLRVIAGLLATVAVYSCTKTPYTHINADIKAKFNYQPGSYWVYVDSLSGATDSFAVVSNKLLPSDALTEAVFINVARYNFDVVNDTSLLRCVLSQNYLRTYALETVVPYPFHTGLLPAGGEVLETGLTYIINGHTFTGVARIAKTVKTADVYADTFYMNADAGIIKLVESRLSNSIVTTKILELQRWNILR
jgi:hypothetical protein